MQILVTGASGMLGSHLLERLAGEGAMVTAWSGTSAENRSGIRLKKVDLADPLFVRAAIEEANPDVIIHAGAVSSAAAVLREIDHAWNVNVRGTEVLALWAQQNRRRILFTSTDLVFDGARSWYKEDDPTAPTLEYGRTKEAAERAVLASPSGLVVRLSLLYGSSVTAHLAYFDQAIADLRAGTPRTFFEDEYRTPLHYVTAASILVGLAQSDATGVIHAGGPERASRFELMQRAARALGLSASLVRPDRRALAPSPEPRPADVSLDTSRLRKLFPNFPIPSIEEALSSV
jgi:dTDP-4-dehydrorhamnose reductase